jgi:hypothetical protein
MLERDRAVDSCAARDETGPGETAPRSLQCGPDVYVSKRHQRSIRNFPSSEGATTRGFRRRSSSSSTGTLSAQARALRVSNRSAEVGR